MISTLLKLLPLSHFLDLQSKTEGHLIGTEDTDNIARVQYFPPVQIYTLLPFPGLFDWLLPL